MTATRDLVADQREQFAFHDDIAYLAQTKRGLTRSTVEEISAFKNEPDWMLQYRLRAYDHFMKRPLPTWTDGLDRINFDNIVYYRKPSEREQKSWDDVPDKIKATFARLVRLCPEGRRGPAPAPGLLPDQRREHRPVRADADRRRRGRQGPLHRGLHGADLRDRVAPRRGRRSCRVARVEGPLHDDP